MPWDNNLKQVGIDAELHRAAKVWAVREGITLRQFIEEAIKFRIRAAFDGATKPEYPLVEFRAGRK